MSKHISETYEDALGELNSFDASAESSKMEITDPVASDAINPAPSRMASNMTIVSKSMVVEGNIRTESPVSVTGKVLGNIDTASDLSITGAVAGDIVADNIILDKAGLRGNSKIKGNMALSNDSVVVGDVDAKNIIVDGKIKGAITVSERAEFKSTSLISGSVCAGSIYMEDGAKVHASVTIMNNEEFDDDSAFELEV